jgi:hypothetical protein
MKRALAAALSVPLMAATPPMTVITFPKTSAIPSDNDFGAELAALGLTRLASSGVSITLDQPATVTFDLLGSESAYNDSFTAGTLTGSESSTFEDHFLSPVQLGSASLPAGSLSGLVSFTNALGQSATVGDNGFGIFLPEGAANQYSSSVLYFGFDDQPASADGDFDDMIVRATFAAAMVDPTAAPEPASWAMMLLGFGVAGLWIRRSRRSSAPLSFSADLSAASRG